jgi:transposase, IS5 family
LPPGRFPIKKVGLSRKTDQAFGEQSSGATDVKAASAPSSVGYGWDRTRIDGTEGTRIWTGHGALAHNRIKISALAA